MWRHYVYIHRRLDTGNIFYVGKGSHRLRNKKQTFERAYSYINRNSYWKNVTNKTRFNSEIIASCKTDEEAQKLEIILIKEIGRQNLVNMTDGGDGSAGLLISDELRIKRSDNAKGKRSEIWKNSIRKARKNGGNGGVVKAGDKLSDSWRANLAAAKIGNKNPWFDKPSPISKKVKNIENGTVYDSIWRAAKAEGVNVKTLYQYLDGSRINKTPLRRI